MTGEKQDDDVKYKVLPDSDDSGSASRPSSATEIIHVQDINTGA
jgi:hypothetical protein